MQHKGLRLAVEKDGLCQMCRTTEMTFKEVGKESVSRSKLHVWSLRSNHRQLGESDCQASGGTRSLHASLVHGECGECVAVCWRELQSRIQSALDQPCSCAYLHSQPGNLYSEAGHLLGASTNTSFRGAATEALSPTLPQCFSAPVPSLCPHPLGP